jgi:hypothetical protein
MPWPWDEAFWLRMANRRSSEPLVTRPMLIALLVELGFAAIAVIQML